PEIFHADDLLRMDLPEPRFIIPGIIPEGLVAFAGKSKIGKSWMAFHLALAVAFGGIALGMNATPVEAGDVLYLAFEDSKRRAQDRLRKMTEPSRTGAPPRLQLNCMSWP